LTILCIIMPVSAQLSPGLGPNGNGFHRQGFGYPGSRNYGYNGYPGIGNYGYNGNPGVGNYGYNGYPGLGNYGYNGYPGYAGCGNPVLSQGYNGYPGYGGYPGVYGNPGIGGFQAPGGFPTFNGLSADNQAFTGGIDMPGIGSINIGQILSSLNAASLG